MNAKNVGTKFDKQRKDDNGGKDRGNYVYKERLEKRITGWRYIDL